MLKLIGACMILIASTMAGLAWAAKYVNRPRQIRLLRSALQRLESEISYGSTPLPSALSHIAHQTPTPIRECFESVSRKLMENVRQRTLIECWQQGMEEQWHRTSLKSTEKEIILQFGYTLGNSDRDDQVKHIRLTLSHLASEEENALLEQQKYEKLFKHLGMLTGALLVILMY
jgi:stage III sporulation protein AB